ncbi:hypothetical protein BHM03_00059603 [Ensete ventricosum]|nr:hypothetical protein BHM03_00059603 [Ensete ventricosum]
MFAIFGFLFLSDRRKPVSGKRAGGAAFGTPRCSMDAAIGGGNYSYDYVPKFPRMNIRDPYRCLGVSHDASEEEIREARNFLLEQYAGHESSVETIEAAYERILFGALVVGWTVGSVVVPMIPSVLLHPSWTIELLTSLISYVFLFLACTFLK